MPSRPNELPPIDVRAAAERIRPVLQRTRLESFPFADPRIDLRLKLECRQETSSFKARGAWNQVTQLTAEEREAGVVATSSGNHGRAVAWAAARAGVKATLFMPENIYPSKLEACRAEHAEVVLCETRAEAEKRCAARVATGAVLIHPYDAPRTVEGAGTVGLEIAEDWPAVEVVVVPVGGGGLIGGSALALHEELGGRVHVLGVEPVGASNMTRALEAGEPVIVDPITTQVQGLSPLATGALNLALVQRYVERVLTLEDAAIFEAQRELVRAGLVVEPAGAAAFAVLLSGALPAELLAGRSARDPLRVACVVSGGNPDPHQVAGLV